MSHGSTVYQSARAPQARPQRYCAKFGLNLSHYRNMSPAADGARARCGGLKNFQRPADGPRKTRDLHLRNPATYHRTWRQWPVFRYPLKHCCLRFLLPSISSRPRLTNASRDCRTLG
jgi:hypothetical protein